MYILDLKTIFAFPVNRTTEFSPDVFVLVFCAMYLRMVALNDTVSAVALIFGFKVLHGCMRAVVLACCLILTIPRMLWLAYTLPNLCSSREFKSNRIMMHLFVWTMPLQACVLLTIYF